MLICLVQLASEMTARGAWGSHPRLRSGPRRRLRRDNFITGYRRFFRTAWLFCCSKLECFIEFVRFKKCSCKGITIFVARRRFFPRTSQGGNPKEGSERPVRDKRRDQWLSGRNRAARRSLPVETFPAPPVPPDRHTTTKTNTLQPSTLNCCPST